MEWNDEIIGQLRALWAEGHSTAEIGRRLGVTKNAIVGKAHRLDLPARPSPIRRDPAGRWSDVAALAQYGRRGGWHLLHLCPVTATTKAASRRAARARHTPA